ncbi:MAG: chemotaxis protein CheD [Dehalococcoidales bacterium]|nr:chemotaxis protein CheD [Dehalococcoidales bacterium]
MVIETTFRSLVDNQDSIIVGLGEMQVTMRQSAVLSCIGLGSCIAVCIYDSLFKVGGMVHIVLPQHDGLSEKNVAKYANTGVPLLIKEVLRQGASRSHLTVKIAGGAQMSLAPGLKSTFRTGERNLEAVVEALNKEGLMPVSSDVGGSKGRTVRLYVNSGKATVKTVGDEEREL